MKKVEVKQFVKYGGHNVTAKGLVNLTFKAQYSQLVNTIQLMQLLNNDIRMQVKAVDRKPMKLGYFRIKDIRISGDGESTIKYVGVIESSEVDNINSLPLNSDDVEEFQVRMLSEVELEGEQENGTELQ